MAIIHRATLSPSKIELVNDWLPSQSWATGPLAGPFTAGSGFRFDDPAGAVGVEILLARTASGVSAQIPLSYRDAALPGGERHLIGTMQHSVLGRRWVYDGLGDPVVLAALATAALTGSAQAAEMVETPDGPVQRPSTAQVQGTGSSNDSDVAVSSGELAAAGLQHVGTIAVVDAGRLRFAVPRQPGVGEGELRRALGVAEAPDASEWQSGLLTGTWTDQPEPQIVALVMRSSVTDAR